MGYQTEQETAIESEPLALQPDLLVADSQPSEQGELAPYQQQPLVLDWQAIASKVASASTTVAPDVTARVEHGDAYDLLRHLDSESVDLIVTSPPYWGHRSYSLAHNWNILRDWVAEGHEKLEAPSYPWYRAHNGVLGLEPYPEWYIEHLVEIFAGAKRCQKSEGSLWVNLGDTYFARWSSIRDKGRQGLGDHERNRRKTPMGGYRQEKQLLLIPARFAFAMQEDRWILRNDLIWYKPNVPPRPENDRLRLAHEHFFHFVKRPKAGRAKYYYDIRHVEPAANDVVVCNVQPGQDGHSATFPTSLITPRILSSSPRRGLVVDPFCGTGRALMAAVQNGRNALGCDVVEDFVAIARRNLGLAVNGD